MKLVLVLGRQMLLSLAVFVHVPESDAAMSAPSVHVYTEQRTRDGGAQGQGAGQTTEQRARLGSRLLWRLALICPVCLKVAQRRQKLTSSVNV